MEKKEKLEKKKKNGPFNGGTMLMGGHKGKVQSCCSLLF